jgi:hypothetical protein
MYIYVRWMANARLQAVAKAASARNSEAAEQAIALVESALGPNNSPFSQRLHALKAHLLLRLGKHDEAVALATEQARPREAGMPQAQWPAWIGVQRAFFSGDIVAVRSQPLSPITCLCMELICPYTPLSVYGEGTGRGRNQTLFTFGQPQ